MQINSAPTDNYYGITPYSDRQDFTSHTIEPGLERDIPQIEANFGYSAVQRIVGRNSPTNIVYQTSTIEELQETQRYIQWRLETGVKLGFLDNSEYSKLLNLADTLIFQRRAELIYEKSGRQGDLMARINDIVASSVIFEV